MRVHAQASAEEVARAAAEGLNAAARRVAGLEGSLRARGKEVEKLRRQVGAGCDGEVYGWIVSRLVMVKDAFCLMD